MQIVGISLVRNEDIFFDLALRNAISFCDRLIIADHGSQDGTAEIGRRWAGNYGHVSYHRIRHPSASHELIQPYVGSPTWVFAVDGDEIYDPQGLRRFRRSLEDGLYHDCWRIYGHTLHCDELSLRKKRARGYMSPPSRTVTKIFNFHALSRWDGPCPERLHGGELSFRAGFDPERQRPLHDELTWDTTPFRCLHAVFLRRSSLDVETAGPRLNISEKNSLGPGGRLSQAFRNALGREKPSSYKEEKYRRGPRLGLDISPFLKGAP